MSEGLMMKYFVLKPSGKDAIASRAAMRQYARLIREENPKLHDDLMSWADQEHAKMMEGGSGISEAIDG